MLHIYRGDGKGKTCAAMGLALRSAFYGKRIIIFQFLKPKGAEVELGERLNLWDSYSFHTGNFVLNEKDKKLARRRVKEGLKILKNKMEGADLVILDELNLCVSMGIVDIDELDFIFEKKNDMDIVITGRGIVSEIDEKADLITEFKEIKHYFHKGVKAKEGIEF